MNKTEEIKKIAEQIAKKYEPQKIILFGSYAWGNPGPDSDIDLLVIKETKDTRQMAREVDRLIFPRRFSLDLIVYTPDQVGRRMKLNDFFIKNILTKGKVLYG
ncbi:nucleotidyltransferase domain-containing protein [Candidatus Parcubacteria bacterium]|nr:MAG: nucleotidyltransferase domain-containing protein [Candidatus Parcubacteria bacterium]